MKEIRYGMPDTSPPVRSQIAYGIYFVSNDVQGVRWDGDDLVVHLSSDLPDQVITESADRLRQRFEKAVGSHSRVIAENDVPLPNRHDLPDELLRGGYLVELHPGCFAFREPLSTLIEFLDGQFLKRFANPIGARREQYPIVLSCDTLLRLNHLTSFPQHIQFVSHFRHDLDFIDRFAAQVQGASRWDEAARSAATAGLQETVQAINPATCYHCYQALANGTVAENGEAITAVGRCHRYEAGNHSQYGRLLDFTMREVILLGPPDYVQGTRQELLCRLSDLVREWGLAGRIETASDPFFTNDTQLMARLQKSNDLKFELRLASTATGGSLAVASSNYLGGTLTKTFNIRAQSGAVIHSSCLAFGLERWALAIVSQYGPNEADWPENLRCQYRNWRENA